MPAVEGLMVSDSEDLREEVRKLLGNDVNENEMEELEAVLYSITSGKIHISK